MKSSEKKEKAIPARTSVGGKIYWIGIALIVVSVLFLLWNFYPILWEEGRYYFGKNKEAIVVTQKEAAALSIESNNKDLLTPVDENFGIVIPKISANTKVIADVDSSNSVEYQRALTKGVAQARGSANPGEEGNVFIFSHSGIDFYEANRYNAIFYLLNKLEKGDEIYLFFQGEKIRYTVREKKTVNLDEVQYMESKPGEKIVTLMTCWPAGTTLKRLIIIGDEV